jgi:hypothetical protein
MHDQQQQQQGWRRRLWVRVVDWIRPLWPWLRFVAPVLYPVGVPWSDALLSLSWVCLQVFVFFLWLALFRTVQLRRRRARFMLPFD